MPLTIAKEDRKLLIGFGVVMALVVGLVIFMVEADGGGTVSSYSAGNSGTKAAFLLLEETGYRPVRWTLNPRALSEVAQNATLILADPMVSDASDVEAVRQFLRRGGRVVATGATFNQFAPHHMRGGTPHFQWKSYKPQEPSELTRGISEIALAPKVYFDKENAPFVDGEESPVARFRYGAGEVIWWSTSEPMSNSGIREKDNAELLLNSVGEAGRGPVLWDEYFHQGGKTVVDSVMGSPLRWGLLQMALVGALVCFTYSRRFEPVRQSVASPRLAPMEFVETLAMLYQKAGGAHVAVEIVYEGFRAALQRRFLVRSDSGGAALATVIADHLPGTNAEETALLLRRIDDAVGDPALRVKEATKLICEMHSLGTRLKLMKAGGE